MTQAEMAEHLAISKGYEWQLEDGRKQPSPELVEALELMEMMPVLDPPKRNGVMRDAEIITLRYIPVVSWAHAGEAFSFEELPKHWQGRVATDVKDPKAFAVDVRGDSMEPQIREGDTVILLPSQEPRNGDIVVVKFKDDGIALKLYHESRDGLTIHLASLNPVYPPCDYHPDDFDKIVPVESVVKKIRF